MQLTHNQGEPEMTTKTTETKTKGITAMDLALKLAIDPTHARALLNLMKSKGMATVETIHQPGARGKGTNMYTFAPDAATKFTTYIKTILTT